MPTTNAGQDPTNKAQGFLQEWSPAIGDVSNSMDYLPIDLGPDPNPITDIGVVVGSNYPDVFPSYDFYNGHSSAIGQGW
jgi:hypothetical protein